jgi:hypothetical protein
MSDISCIKIIKMDFVTQPFKINDILLWYDRKELVLSPKFQRRAVWKPKGKSNLIDSIIKGFPLPPFFIREELNLKERRTIREVIDGQQRIRAITEFIAGTFTMQKIHNEQYAKLKFVDLPEDVQSRFLTYVLSINVVGQITDKEVYEMFSRLNAYSVPLNQPERANALYTGVFKQKIDELAKTFLQFWLNAGIFTDANVARMLEIQLTAELIAVMLRGITHGKEAIYNKTIGLYIMYDDSFDKGEEFAKRFCLIMEYVNRFFGEDLKNTEFRRPPLFYSLFTALYDIIYGLPPENTPISQTFYEDAIDKVKNDLLEMSDAIRQSKSAYSEDEVDDDEVEMELVEEEDIEEEIPVLYLEFVQASLSSTDKLNQRKIRHRILKIVLLTAFQQ